jgi:hypothetical protein
VVEDVRYGMEMDCIGQRLNDIDVSFWKDFDMEMYIIRSTWCLYAPVD